MNFSAILLGIIAREPLSPLLGIQRKLEDDGFWYATRHSRFSGCVIDTLILFLKNLFATPDQLFRPRRPLPAEKLQRLGLQLVSRHEKFFQLLLELGRQLLNAVQLPLAVRVFRNGDDAIVADSVVLGLLVRLKHANELAAQYQP